jgi:hypothetical protein
MKQRLAAGFFFKVVRAAILGQDFLLYGACMLVLCIDTFVVRKKKSLDHMAGPYWIIMCCRREGYYYGHSDAVCNMYDSTIWDMTARPYEIEGLDHMGHKFY